MRVGISWYNSGKGKGKLFQYRLKTSNTFIAKMLMFFKIPFVWDIKVMENEEAN